MEMNDHMNHLRKHRKVQDFIKTKLWQFKLGEVYRKPVYWIDGERCKGGMNIIWAFMWNVRT